MNLFSKYYSRLKKYRSNLLASLFSHLLTALFTVFSIPMIIPFFQLLFDREPKELTSANTDGLVGKLNHFYIELIANNTKEQALFYVCLALIAVFFLKNAFRYLSQYFMIPVRNGLVRDLRNELFDKVLKLPISYFKEKKKGDLLTRFSADALEVETSILQVLEVFIKSPIVILGSILFMLYFSPALTSFVFLLFIFTVLIIGGVTRSLKKQSKEAQSRLGHLVSVVDEAISGVRVIRSFNAQDVQKQKFSEENESYKGLINRVMWKRDASSPLSEFLGVSMVALLLWYGSRLVFSGDLQPETFFAFILAFYQIIEPAKSFSTAYYSVQKGTAAMHRIDEVLESPIQIKDKSNAKSLTDFAQAISFDDVSFQYSDAEEKVLDGVSFELKKGHSMALVGPSGVGKTTILDLLLRLYEPNTGNIEIDGHNIQNLSLASLNDLISVVDQHAILFHDSLWNNIAFGRSAIDKNKVISSAEMAYAAEFIEKLPNGYDTVIGEQGMKLSAGQRQRIALARALYKDSPILILDEATSALDTKSERLIQLALKRAMQGRTSLVVAHRLNTIKEVDRILVFKQGRIVESGRHEELLNKEGEYFSMVTQQSI